MTKKQRIEKKDINRRYPFMRNIRRADLQSAKRFARHYPGPWRRAFNAQLENAHVGVMWKKGEGFVFISRETGNEVDYGIKHGWTLDMLMTLDTIKEIPGPVQDFCFSIVADGVGCYYFLNCKYSARKEVDEWNVLSEFGKNYALKRADTTVDDKLLDLDECKVDMWYSTDDVEYRAINETLEVDGTKVNVVGYQGYPLYSTDDIYGVTIKYLDE